MNSNDYQPGKNAVSFESEGATLKGDLFLPPNFDTDQSYPGLVVTGSWTTVKEQMAGLYAERLSQQGFAALAFDFRHYGESEGEPRQYENPDEKSQDIQNGATFLLSLPFVRGDKVGGLGVCASTGYLAHAAAGDERFGALALVAPWLHNAKFVRDLYGGEEGVQQRLDDAEAARKKYEQSGEVEFIPGASSEDESAAMYAPDPSFLGYYLTPGRVSPHWDNRLAVISWEPWLTYDAISIAPQVRVPVLMVHSEDAAIPDGAREFYLSLGAPKEFYWMPGTQLDFYDQEPQVTKASTAAATHFAQTL